MHLDKTFLLLMALIDIQIYDFKQFEKCYMPAVL